MPKNKSKLITGFLIVLISCLLVFVFYIVVIINKTDDNSTQETVIQKQTKAVGSTYRKTVNIDEGQPAPSKSVAGNNPSIFPTGKSISPTKTLLAMAVSPTVLPTMVNGLEPTEIVTNIPTISVALSGTVNPEAPTPTEIILAYRSTNITGSQLSGAPAILSPTRPITSTRTTSLPESGFINNSLIIFAVSVMTIFFAFIF